MGTITVPVPLPSPAEDSEALRKAFQGWGTDENAVIRILGHRLAPHRREIAEAYQKLYEESLVDRLHSELSGDFRRAVVWWAQDPAERDARLAEAALKRKGDESVSVIIEIACASSPNHLVEVRRAYCSLFKTSLEEDIAARFPPHQPLGKLLVGLVTSFRYSGELVDEETARSEAATLCDAVSKRQLDRKDVLRILSTRSKPQLRATFQRYGEQSGSAIDEDIKSQGSNSTFASLLKEVVWCLATPEKHFAAVVRNSVVGLGTDEDSLTRAIVTRAEIDMQKVKEEYIFTYKTRLEDDVIDDTSGNYKDFLITLLGSPGK